MPRITAVTYGRTFNNGNYEASRIDLSCDVLEGEKVETIFRELMLSIEDMRSQERKYQAAQAEESRSTRRG